MRLFLATTFGLLVIVGVLNREPAAAKLPESPITEPAKPTTKPAEPIEYEAVTICDGKSCRQVRRPVANAAKKVASAVKSVGCGCGCDACTCSPQQSAMRGPTQVLPRMRVFRDARPIRSLLFRRGCCN